MKFALSLCMVAAYAYTFQTRKPGSGSGCECKTVTQIPGLHENIPEPWGKPQPEPEVEAPRTSYKPKSKARKPLVPSKKYPEPQPKLTKPIVKEDPQVGHQLDGAAAEALKVYIDELNHYYFDVDAYLDMDTTAIDTDKLILSGLDLEDFEGEDGIGASDSESEDSDSDDEDDKLGEGQIMGDIFEYFEDMYTEGKCPQVQGMRPITQPERLSGDWYTQMVTIGSDFQPDCNHLKMQVNQNGLFQAKQEFNLGSKHITIHDIKGAIKGDNMFTQYDDGVLQNRGIVLDTDYCSYMILYNCMDDFCMHGHDLTEEDEAAMSGLSQEEKNKIFDASMNSQGNLKMEDVVIMTRKAQITEEEAINLENYVEQLLPGFDADRLIPGVPEHGVCHFDI